MPKVNYMTSAKTVSAKHLAKFQFCYCDIETFAPGSDNPEFWYGGVKCDGVYRWTDNIDQYLDWLFFRRKAEKKILLFFNANYDMSFLQYYLRTRYGYKLNPSKNTGWKTIFSGQKWEVYTDDKHRQPIFVVDLQPLLTMSVRAWGDKLGFPKGETPIVDEYHYPTEKELAYLKRDIEIIEKATQINGLEENIKQGSLTISSIVNHDIKNKMRDLEGESKRTSGFKGRHLAPVEQQNNVPFPVQKKIDEMVQKYDDIHVFKKGKDILYKATQDELKEYRSRCVRAFMKALEDKYTKQLLNVARERNRVKYMTFDVDLDCDVYGEDIHAKYMNKIIISTVNQSIRPALRGGISWVNPKYRNKILPAGFTLDINSMYPSVILDTELPYRYVGMTTEKDDVIPNKHKFFIAEIEELKADIKPNHHPWLKRSTAYTKDKFYENEINWKGSFNKRKGVWDTVLTSADINYLYETYDVKKISYRRVFYFESDDNFTKATRDYISFWRKRKEKDTGAIRQFDKLHLNSLWGRWAMTEKVVDDGGRKIDVGEKTSNLVSAMFVTAYARIRLNRMMNRFYNYVVYTDTDSVHVLFPPGKTQKDIENSISNLIDPVVFGKWKIEQTWERAKYLKPKTYCHEDKQGKLDFTSAGVPKKYIQHEFKRLEDFRLGVQFQVIKKVKIKDGRHSLQMFPSTL